MGIPAIGSKGCGIEDAINNYNSGILINPKNKKEIVEALRLIMENNNTYRGNALKWANCFKWDIVIQKYLNLLNNE
jgi:glycosyltransferase involved in cell wall biosynthesis